MNKRAVAVMASLIGVFALVLSVQQVQQYRSSAKKPRPTFPPVTTPTPTAYLPPTTTGLQPQADMNRDGVISVDDVEVISWIMEVVSNGGWSYVFFAADLNHDGQVNIVDMSYVGARVGSSVSKCLWADFNSDGKVDLNDLNLFTDKFGPINQFSNRYDLDNDSYVTILDVVAAQYELGNLCN